MSFWRPSPVEVQAELEAAKSGWAAVAAYNFEVFSGVRLRRYVTVLIDALAPMLLGMIAFRIGLLQGKWPMGRLIVLTSAAFLIGLPVNFRETQAIIESNYSIHGFYAGLMTYDIGRVLLAFGWLGVVLLLCKAEVLRWARAALAAVGRMALTNYLAQSVIAAILFVDLGYFGELQRSQLCLVVLGIWTFNIGFSLAWLSVFRMGPFEWLWRAGTYGAWPPLLKRSATLQTAPS